MKVSFLVTYFNQQEYVQKNMNSILNIKKNFDWEVLVGDDGSTDDTLSEVNKFVEKYPNKIKVFVMDREDGKKYDSVKRASANRLNLIKNMTGDFFCIIDGDDYYCNADFVEQAIEMYEKNSEISIVAFGYKYVGAEVDTKKILLPSKYDRKVIDKEKYLSFYYIPSGACVYKKNWDKDRILFLERLEFYDDNNILINNLNYGEMFYIPNVVYAYRQNACSVFNSMDKIEQSVLNVEGLDIDVKLVDEKFRESIYIRNIFSIKNMFLKRKKLKGILGEEKYNKYYYACKKIKDSLSYSILTYDSIDKKNKMNVVFMIIRCYIKKFVFILKERIS